MAGDGAVTWQRALCRRFDVKVIGPPAAAAVNGAGRRRRAAGTRSRPRRAERSGGPSGGAGGDTLVSPLQGNMWKVLVEQGQTVEEGQLVCIIEAMKMENEITAHKAGVISDSPSPRASRSPPARRSPSSPRANSHEPREGSGRPASSGAGRRPFGCG